MVNHILSDEGVQIAPPQRKSFVYAPVMHQHFHRELWKVNDNLGLFQKLFDPIVFYLVGLSLVWLSRPRRRRIVAPMNANAFGSCH